MEQASREEQTQSGAEFVRQLQGTGATEIAICGSGKAFHRRGRNAWTPAGGPPLKHADIVKAIEAVAASGGASFEQKIAPWMHATTPEGHRACGVAGQRIVDHDAALYIRGAEHANEQDGVEDATAKALNEGLARPDLSHDTRTALRVAAKAQCLIVAGPTNTGKTTLLNELLKHLDDGTRIITIEQTRELQVRSRNKLQLTVRRSDAADTNRVMPDTAEAWQIAVRSGPDILIFGELTSENAVFVREMLIPSSVRMWTTVHAASAHEVAERLWELASQGGSQVKHEDVEDAVRTTCAIIRTGAGEPRIEEVLLPR